MRKISKLIWKLNKEIIIKIIMNIYILTEITKRELDSNILLALVAAQNGSSVLISNMDTIST